MARHHCPLSGGYAFWAAQGRLRCKIPALYVDVGDGAGSTETTMRWSALAVAALLTQAGPALAAIRIIDSTYEGGVTTVSGQTKPHEKVTLDGKYTTTSDGGGHFEFHVRYKPYTCMSNIVAGEDNYAALLNGCLANDAAADLARSDKLPLATNGK